MERPCKRAKVAAQAADAVRNKVAFVQRAIDEGLEAFAKPRPLDPDVVAALAWQHERSSEEAPASNRVAPPRPAAPRQIKSFREKATLRIERMAQQFHESGETDTWLHSADCITRGVSRDVCGPALELLSRECGHADKEAHNLFREVNLSQATMPSARLRQHRIGQGAPLIGTLPRSNIGTPAEFKPALSLQELLEGQCCTPAAR